MAGPTFAVRGGKEFRSALKAVDASFPKALAKANRSIATDTARESRAAAGALGGMQTAAARAITGAGSQASAKLQINTNKVPFGNAAFWGAKKRTGWYAAPQFAGGTPQFPPWVGNTWEPGVAGEGPYAINDTLARMRDKIMNEYGDAVMEIARQAFPD